MSYRIAIQGGMDANLVFRLKAPATWIVGGGWAPIPHDGVHQDDPGINFYIDGWRGHQSLGIRAVGIMGNELIFTTAYNGVDRWELWLAIDSPGVNVAHMTIETNEGRGNGQLIVRSAIDTQTTQISPGNTAANPLHVAIPLF